MDFLAQIAGSLLRLIYDFIGDYGISIIIFTIVTKLLLFPLSLKQVQSTRIQAVIQPKMKEIQEKYADNREKQSQALMDLYREHNYNPLSGCLPLLIQIPIILGLFNALREPALYVFQDSQELLQQATHQSFLWIPNLSQPDLMGNIFTLIGLSAPEFILNLAGLLPIISAALTYYQMTSTPGMNSGNSSMKFMAFIMPLMFILWGTSLSAGIILYWTVSSLLQVLQQKIITKRKAEVSL